MGIKLGLDQALVSVDASKSYLQDVIEVFGQTEVCNGCPLAKISDLVPDEPHKNYFLVNTKHPFRLELRQAANGSRICSIPNLDFNNHAHYSLRLNLESVEENRCKLNLLESGESSYHAMAILAILLIAVIFIEKAVNTLMTRRSGDRERKLAQVSRLDGDSGEQERETKLKEEEENSESPSVQMQSSRAHQTQPVVVRASSSTRIECLDTFRGITIAAMIMVNYGGAGYRFLEHRPWNGLTVADCVFPFFVFAVGASVALSSHAQVRRSVRPSQMLLKVAQRSAIIFGIGLSLNSRWLEPDMDLAKLRFTGVLQRLAISYLAVGILYSVELALCRWIRAQGLGNSSFLSRIYGPLLELMMAANCLGIYLYFSFLFDYSPNECPVGYLGPGGITEGGRFANCTGGAAAWLDRKLLGTQHLYQDRELRLLFGAQVTHDPEGVLGCTTSILLALMGLQCGKTLARRPPMALGNEQPEVARRHHAKRLQEFLKWNSFLGLTCLSALLVPINKKLWSISFVCCTGSLSFGLVWLLYIWLDVYHLRPGFVARLLNSAGKNSIFLYVGHSLLSGMLPWWFPVPDPSSHLQLLGRLVWATLLWLLIGHQMASKRLFIKL